MGYKNRGPRKKPRSQSTGDVSAHPVGYATFAPAQASDTPIHPAVAQQPTERLVRLKDAANRLGISERTLWNWRSQGRLTVVLIGDGPRPLKGVLESELVRFMRSSRRGA
jgi:predicted DNA-binding transcriptional regulator AlpA